MDEPKEDLIAIAIVGENGRDKHNLEVQYFDEWSDVPAEGEGLNIYTWCCEGKQNWLERGHVSVNRYMTVVLPVEFTEEQYQLPDDEPDWDVLYGLEQAIDAYRHGNLHKSDLHLRLAECSRDMQEQDDENQIRVGKILEDLWRYL